MCFPDIGELECPEEILLLLEDYQNNFSHTNKQRVGFANRTNQSVYESVDSRDTVTVQEGDFPKLFRELRKALNLYFNCMKPSEILAERVSPWLPLCLLCAGLEIATRSSPRQLRRDMGGCGHDAVYCIPKLLEIAFLWKGDDTLRLVVVAAAISVLSRVAALFPNSIASFGISLLHGFWAHVPMEIQLHTACVLVGLLRVNTDPQQLSILTKQIDANHSVVIPVLSTASTSEQKEQVREALGALLLLSQSPIMRRRLGGRRDVLRAVDKQLGNSDQGIRLVALSLCKFFFDMNDSDNTNSLEENAALAGRALCRLLAEAGDTKTLVEASRVAVAASTSRTLDSKFKENLMSSLLRLANDDKKAEEVTVEAALSYLRSASRAESRIGVLTNTMEFVRHSHQGVRQEALLLLKDIAFWNPRSLFLNSLGSLEKLAEVASHGSTDDCSEALQICRQLASEDFAPPIICMNKSLISVIVDLVTMDPIHNRSAYIDCMHIIIALLSEDSNIPSFLPFNQLLPWLIVLANTTSDEDMKQQIASVIVRFTMAKLREISSRSE